MTSQNASSITYDVGNQEDYTIISTTRETLSERLERLEQRVERLAEIIYDMDCTLTNIRYAQSIDELYNDRS